MIKKIYYPDHVTHGIHGLKRSVGRERDTRIFGMDTETYRGYPVSIQISDGKEVFFSYTDQESIFGLFWTWIKPRLLSHGLNICYVHNLSFDLRVLFCKWHQEMYRQFSDIHFDAGPVKIAMLYGKVNTATLSEGELKLHIYDSRAFTLTSLESSLSMFHVDSVKLKAPENLGQWDPRELKPDDPKRLEFERYADQDARAAQALGAKILSFHKEFNVTPAITLPSFSAKIFRSRFLKEDTLPFPPIEVVKASELSFHGGKNGYYAAGPRVFDDMAEIDINSAYPAAMASFPGITLGRFEKVRSYRPGLLGVYSLSGVASPNPYPVIFDHEFNPVQGNFADLWHTGYETELALREGSGVSVSSLYGYVWLPDRCSVNPLGAFVRHFYKLKETTPKSSPYYTLYKIVLNSLFGKFMGAAEIRTFVDDSNLELIYKLCGLPQGKRIDERWDDVLGKYVAVARLFKAGGMYNPFIGTQITGYARKMIYELEKRLGAVHTATDSIKTRERCIEATKGLGGYKLECRGRCYIFRNKLYLHFARDYSLCKHQADPIRYPSKIHKRDSRGKLTYTAHPRAGEPMIDSDGQHLCKYALHAYKGPLWFLFDNRQKLLKGDPLEYDYVHVIGLREGLKRGERPCDFVLRSEELNLNPAKAEYLDEGLHDKEEVSHAM